MKSDAQKLLEKQAKTAVRMIVADLTDRRDLKNVWWGIDEDIQAEIQYTWRKIIMKAVEL